MALARLPKVKSQGRYQGPWQYCHAIFGAFAIAHRHHPALQVNVLYAQTQRLEHAQATSVQQPGH
jgi:hypothetical protein